MVSSSNFPAHDKDVVSKHESGPINGHKGFLGEGATMGIVAPSIRRCVVGDLDVKSPVRSRNAAKFKLEKAKVLDMFQYVGG